MAERRETRAVPDFRSTTIAVVGDLICDRYVRAEPRKLSREAPVMVLRHQSDSARAGGAANVARNLRALGADVRLFGAVGRDADGRELLRLLEEDGIDTGGVETVPGWTTPTKTRILAAEPRRSLQQVLRIDREPETPLVASARAGLADAVTRLDASVDGLIVSDYEYGAVDAGLGRAVAARAKDGLVCVLDPRTLTGFDGLTALTPNVGELVRFAGRHELDSLEEPSALAAAAQTLLAKVDVRYLLVTRGNLGMALFGEDIDERGVAVEASGHGDVTDVSGAGDTAAAVFTLALAGGRPAVEAMALANAASGVVVMEHGVAVCSPVELERALRTAPAAAHLAKGAR